MAIKADKKLLAWRQVHTNSIAQMLHLARTELDDNMAISTEEMVTVVPPMMCTSAALNPTKKMQLPPMHGVR
jgi:hypothetical protein